jgi:hypothetical protein
MPSPQQAWGASSPQQLPPQLQERWERQEQQQRWEQQQQQQHWEQQQQSVTCTKVGLGQLSKKSRSRQLLTDRNKDQHNMHDITHTYEEPQTIIPPSHPQTLGC